MLPAEADRPAIAQADESEIEITPEMIEAGIDKLYDLPELLGPSREELGEALKCAFHAMLSAHREIRGAKR